MYEVIENLELDINYLDAKIVEVERDLKFENSKLKAEIEKLKDQKEKK